MSRRLQQVFCASPYSSQEWLTAKPKVWTFWVKGPGQEMMSRKAIMWTFFCLFFLCFLLFNPSQLTQALRNTETATCTPHITDTQALHEKQWLDKWVKTPDESATGITVSVRANLSGLHSGAEPASNLIPGRFTAPSGRCRLLHPRL